ncbi:hypothetical protein IHE44_0002265 [Lamprotornis superbus]|uniref:Uncharacterized protein n=1 Tax=Lamprotornis superbus TaxID=245042 RepID=A0A835NUK6_9PASS|nr:hypothetical protein IHE44_0002265 [Lamprotornis superbus]
MERAENILGKLKLKLPTEQQIKGSFKEEANPVLIIQIGREFSSLENCTLQAQKTGTKSLFRPVTSESTVCSRNSSKTKQQGCPQEKCL